MVIQLLPLPSPLLPILLESGQLLMEQDLKQAIELVRMRKGCLRKIN